MDIYKKQMAMIGTFLLLLCFISVSKSSAVQKKRETIQDKSYFYYTVKKGDNLWALSQKFYNSNWVWPGLWGINGKIKNPHLIYPGEKIKIFLRKTLQKQPSVKYVKKLPQNTENKIMPTFYYPGMDSLGFIKQRALKPLGQVIKSRNNKVMMSQSDIIYIDKLRNKTIIPGKKYTVFSTEKIDFQDHGKRFKGIKYLIKGIIRILENNGQYVTAKVLRSFHYISEGDLIMDYKKRGREIKIKDPVKNINAEIICSENKNSLISDNNIAFINKGSRNRIKTGQIYSVFKSQDLRKSQISGKRISLAPLKIGRLIVLHTEKTASTVLIISSQKVIRAGYIVH